MISSSKIINIDVDGIDLDVVRGSMETIKKFRPSIIIEHYSQDLISTMNKIDYQSFSFTTFGIAKLNCSLIFIYSK